MWATVDEGEAGPSHQILDRPRAQHFPRPSLGQDPSRDVHRDPADVIADQLDLASVQPDPDLQAPLGQLGPDGLGRADRPVGRRR